MYHVLNRANGRLRIFKKKEDFAAFEAILAEGMERVDMRICGYCIMGNHWHLLLWPREDADLSDYMRWITLTHTQRPSLARHGWHRASVPGPLQEFSHPRRRALPDRVAIH